MTTNKTAKFKVGQVLRGKSSINFEEGPVKSITESRGAKPGLLYEIGNSFFFEDELTLLSDKIKNTPNNYYDQIKHIEWKMENDIYELIKTHGKKKELKDNHQQYTVKFSKKHPCYVDARGQRAELTEALVLDSPSYNRGYLLFKGHYKDSKEIQQFSFETALPHQQFNVYSPLYHKLFSLK